jgi:hypothetical protein
MHARFPASLGIRAITLTVLSLTAVTAAAQTRHPHPASDGTPDFQGVWISKSATPLERPKALEGRPLLTDTEVAELKKRADRIFSGGTKSDFPGGDNVFLSALENLDQYKNPNATAGIEDMVERVFENRTSLIVDPADGKIPPLTPEGQRRQAAAAAARIRSDPAGPEDVTSDRRCLTFGTPRPVQLLPDRSDSGTCDPHDGVHPRGPDHPSRWPPAPFARPPAVERRLAGQMGGKGPGRRHHQLLSEEHVHGLG